MLPCIDKSNIQPFYNWNKPSNHKLTRPPKSPRLYIFWKVLYSLNKSSSVRGWLENSALAFKLSSLYLQLKAFYRPFFPISMDRGSIIQIICIVKILSTLQQQGQDLSFSTTILTLLISNILIYMNSSTISQFDLEQKMNKIINVQQDYLAIRPGRKVILDNKEYASMGVL